MTPGLRQQTLLRLGTAQVPRLTSRILVLGAMDLAAELRTQAAQNPALEYSEPGLPPVHDPLPSLKDHLAAQLETTPMDPKTRKDALRCLGEMDHKGYLAGPGDLAAATGLSNPRARKARDAIRSLSPVGVGAADLRDRLLMQLDDMEQGADVRRARMLVERHFSALSRGRRDLLPKTGLERVLAVIDKLRPSLANEFAQAAEALTPELEAYQVRGYWKVRALPGQGEVRLAGLSGARSASAPWKRKVREARALVGALEFRDRTLLVVAQALVDRQRDYFMRGRGHLRAVRLRDLAADTGLSVSTVAATLSNKSITSPAGTVALKYLLQRKAAGGARSLSAAQLQEAIRELISTEDPAEPLTDEQIMLELNNSRGVAVGRRTVAKHRDRAGLLASNLRRKRG